MRVGDLKTAFTALIEGFLSKAAYAPGIPSKATEEIPEIDKPTLWRLVIQQHPAQKAGDHYDIRLVDDVSGKAHSWATKKEMPELGGKIKTFQTFTHTSQYADYQGPLSRGYGKTREGETVKKVVDVPTEIIQADNNMIRFNTYEGTSPRELLMVRNRKSPKSWYLMDVTKTKENFPGVQFVKSKYKEIAPEAIDMSDSKQVMSAKLDGGHNLFILEGGKRPRALSYREPKKGGTGIIEHTHKLQSLYHAETPKEFGDTVLRGEVFARSVDEKKPVPAETVAGMLNANVWKSRELQKQHGRLRAAVFDVVRYKGKDMSTAPYSEKIEVLKEVAGKMPELEVPDMGFSQKEKEELLKSIESKAHPSTHEGVVLWPLEEAKRPVKVKFLKDYDVFIRGVEQAINKHGAPKPEMGALSYAFSPRGKVVGRIGTGFTQAQRRDIWKRPEVFTSGVVARVKAQTKYPSGALGKPRFLGWHADKSSPEFWREVGVS
jgi:hypothetical protein